jgi:hypothetical protein
LKPRESTPAAFSFATGGLGLGDPVAARSRSISVEAGTSIVALAVEDRRIGLDRVAHLSQALSEISRSPPSPNAGRGAFDGASSLRRPARDRRRQS